MWCRSPKYSDGPQTVDFTVGLKDIGYVSSSAIYKYELENTGLYISNILPSFGPHRGSTNITLTSVGGFDGGLWDNLYCIFDKTPFK